MDGSRLRFAVLFSGLLLCLAAAGTLAACEGDIVLSGRELGIHAFERPVGGIACADCHGESETPRQSPDWVLPGHPLAGVAERPSLWGGRFEAGEVESAVLFCVTRFQHRAPADYPAREDVDEFRLVPHRGDDLSALFEYVRSFAGPADAVPLRRTDDVFAATELEGDYDRGEAVWARSCAVCHGDEAGGGLGPPLDGADVPDPFSLADYVRQGADVGARKAWMPWFTTDDLSTQDLADLISRWTE